MNDGLLTPGQAARFHARVNQRGENECWLWTGRTLASGYGQFYAHPKYYRVHRLAYMLAIGPIPDGLTIDHLCRNKLCVNPTHLEAVTVGENVRRAVPHWSAVTRTHCRNGHELSSKNTYHYIGRRRQCRTCHAASERARRARMKEST